MLLGSLSLSLHINQLLCKDFFILNKTTHFYFIYGQHRAQTFIYMNCKFEKLYSLCPPPPLLFLSLKFMKEPRQEKAYIDNAACLFKLCLSSLKSTPV